MTERVDRGRRVALPPIEQLLFWAACVCQVGVWLLVSIGGMVNPGFRQYEHYLSTLAARGASAPTWGVVALLLLSAGLFCLVPILLRWRPFVAACVAVAALSAALVAFLPLPCPPRERFCVSPSIGPSLEVPHAAAVLLMCGAMIAAVVAGIVQLRAGGEARPRVWPAAVVAAALVALGSDWLLTLTGLAQRGWLLIGQAAVLAVAAGALGELDRRKRLAAKRLATEATVQRAPRASRPSRT